MCERIARRAYYKDNTALSAEAYWRSKLRWEYGISEDIFWTMHAHQGGLCAICGEAPAHERLAVDHDHATGAVRGLLCRRCNWAMGKMKDDPMLVRNMLVFLEAGVDWRCQPDGIGLDKH